ncbi:MAG TPA: hypothetical protein VFD76_01070 [Gemmatimonadales bacterium]|nr:hypothetical protein [Gemmatimonadales bacterium]
MTLRRTIATFRRARQAFGWRAALWAFAVHGLRKVIPCHVLRAMYITAALPQFTEAPPGLTAGFVDRAVLDRVTPDATYEMPPSFVDDALGKGDECYAIAAGDQVVAFGWYAHTPTRLSDDLRVYFDSTYVYMYKGLTVNGYRGRRLHAIAKTRALHAYRARGFKGLVQCVDVDNLRSLRSAHRMGFIDFGWVLAVRILGRYLTWTTPGCAAFGFRVEPVRHAAAPARGAPGAPPPCNSRSLAAP